MHWDIPFFVLDLGLYIIDGIRRLHFESDCLAGEGLDEDLHDWCLKMVSGEVEGCLSQGDDPPRLYIGWCGDWIGLPHWYDSARPLWKPLESRNLSTGSADIYVQKNFASDSIVKPKPNSHIFLHACRCNDIFKRMCLNNQAESIQIR